MKSKQAFKIGSRIIGEDAPAFVIAELSANHNHSFDEAVRLVEAAADSGADAIKVQTYTPDTITIDCRSEIFQIGEGTIWEGKNLYDLYADAYMPWEWQPKLKAVAESKGVEFFSTPFDPSSVRFLETFDVPAFKIASFELVDHALLELVAKTGKPVIMSTGMATLGEIEESVHVLRRNGCVNLVLLKCTSAYPAPPEEANLKTISHLCEAFDVFAGLSDHTLGIAVSVAAVAMGAKVIEKHFTMSREIPGPDSEFSLEPDEFEMMVDSIRVAEKAIGRVNYEITEKASASRSFRRSLFISEDMGKGEKFTHKNVRSIRPGHGLAPKHLDSIIGRQSTSEIVKGTPLVWDLVD